MSAALAKITSMVDAHPARHIVWLNGTVPIGYYYLVALTYARWCLKLQAGDPVALFIARPGGHDSAHDALSYYRGEFNRAGIYIDTPGVLALRATFTLVGGDGGPESSGQWSCGKDPGASNTDAETCEAGIWQTSYNARASNPALFDALFGLAQRFPNSGFLEYAKEGAAAPRSADMKNWGDGPGVVFQDLSKKNPAFACATAALVFRCLRGHYGTLRDYKARVEPVMYDMLLRVEKIVDADRETFAAELSEDPANPIPLPQVFVTAPKPKADPVTTTPTPAPKPKADPVTTTPTPAPPNMHPELLALVEQLFPLIDSFFPAWEGWLVGVIAAKNPLGGKLVDFVLTSARAQLQAQIGSATPAAAATPTIPLAGPMEAAVSKLQADMAALLRKAA